MEIKMHNEKDNNSKGTANTRIKLSPIAIVLIVIAVIALFSVIIAGAVSSNNKKSGDNTVGMTLTEKNLKPQSNSSNNSVADRSLTKVEILMDDTAVVVGTTFKAAAVVEPENTDKALVWSSSNEDIMKVDSDGVVTVNNVGVAALTATVGDVSDAVAIEGIKSVSAGSANGYVVYTGNGSITGSNSSNSSSSGASNSGTSGRTGYSYNHRMLMKMHNFWRRQNCHTIYNHILYLCIYVLYLWLNQSNQCLLLLIHHKFLRMK
jgi:hypothetical protein